MINPRNFEPPQEVVRARREAILNAVQSARLQKEHYDEVEEKRFPLCVPSKGFPIILSTKEQIGTPVQVILR